MAQLQLFRGLPTFDWRQSTVDVLTQGAFEGTSVAASVITLAFGTIVLEVTGTGLDTTGPRTITAGTISSIKLIVDGTEVAQLDTFSGPYTAAMLQAVLNDPPDNVWDDFAAFIAAEPLNVIGSAEEDWILGGTGNDTIAGGEERDLVFAGAGDDEVFATDNVRFWGDYIQPGLGTNVIHGTEVINPDGWVDGHDMVFTDLTVDVTLDLAAGIATATGMHTTFEEVQWVAGGGGNDTLTGGNAKFSKEGFAGMVGNDVINGKGGRDGVSYGEETDFGSVNEAGVWVTGTMGVKVDLAAETGRDSFGDNDTLIGIEDVAGTKFKDTIRGNSSRNEFQGGDAADKMDGRSGKDTLEGGAGRDTLTGGSSNDQFLYRDVSESKSGSTKRDYITDFNHGTDDIDVEMIDANITKGGNQKFKFDTDIGTSSSSVAKGHIGWYQIDKSGTSNDRTIIKANIDGDSTIEFQIELKGLIDLSKGDFIL
jgi:Ca2+-binding RTX toxin-like protein